MGKGVRSVSELCYEQRLNESIENAAQSAAARGAEKRPLLRDFGLRLRLRTPPKPSSTIVPGKEKNCCIIINLKTPRPEVNNKACEFPQNLLPNCMNWQLDRLGPIRAISKKFCRIIEHFHSQPRFARLPVHFFETAPFRTSSKSHYSGRPYTKAECIRIPTALLKFDGNV